MPTYRQSRISDTCMSVVKWLHKLNKQMEKKMDELNFIRRDVRIDNDARTNVKFDDWVDDVFDLHEDSIENAYFTSMDKPLYGTLDDIDFN